MDDAQVAVNCLCSVQSCATCWCPDSELSDGHSRECHYCRMTELMEQLQVACDELLDEDDHLVGRVKDKEEVEKCLSLLATPDIEGFFNIEVFDIKCFFHIECSTFNIDSDIVGFEIEDARKPYYHH